MEMKEENHVNCRPCVFDTGYNKLDGHAPDVELDGKVAPSLMSAPRRRPAAPSPRLRPEDEPDVLAQLSRHPPLEDPEDADGGEVEAVVDARPRHQPALHDDRAEGEAVLQAEAVVGGYAAVERPQPVAIGMVGGLRYIEIFLALLIKNACHDAILTRFLLVLCSCEAAAWEIVAKQAMAAKSTVGKDFGVVHRRQRPRWW